MKNRLKKLGLLLATSAMLSTQVSAASITPTATAPAHVVTVANTANVTISGITSDVTELSFKTYQAIYATYDWYTNAFKYEIADWAYTALATAYPTTITSKDLALAALIGLTNIPSTPDSTDPSNKEQYSDIVDALGKHIKSGASPAPSEFAGGFNYTTGNSVTAALPAGAYFVLPSSSNSSFMNMLVSVDTCGMTDAMTNEDEWEFDGHGATLKGQINTITKTVSDQTPGTTPNTETASAKIGDIVDFTITANVPVFPLNATDKTFIITDTPVNMKILNDSDHPVVINRKVNGAVTTTVPTTSYTLSRPAGDDKGLIINFTTNYDATFRTKVGDAYTDISNADEVQITYSAQILNTAAVNSDSNTNTVELKYASNPYKGETYNTTNDDVKIYTYGLNLDKQGDGSDLLPDTGFKLYTMNGTEKKYIKVFETTQDTQGTYTVCDGSEDASKIKEEVFTGADGKLHIAGIDADVEYYLEETTAPSGYSINTQTMKFTITAATVSDSSPEKTKLIKKLDAAADGSWTANVQSGGTVDTDGYVDFAIKDTILVSLPSTGGMGTYLFTIIGVAVMATMAFFFFRGRKAEEE